MRTDFVLATRGSRLALWQAEYVKARIEQQHPECSIFLNVIKTKGDLIWDVPLSQVGGKGLFVKEIEEALLTGQADLAVHSIKDVPMLLPEGLILGCIPEREQVTDCYLSQDFSTPEALPVGSKIGTSSLRRQAQILAKRPDLAVETLRGNVDTRLRKLTEGQYDAIILASAGLRRLGLSARYMQTFDPFDFLPAPGQGALGIECREDDYDILVLLAGLEDRSSRVCVEAERAVLQGLNGGCHAPVAAYAQLKDAETIRLKALVGEPDGTKIIVGEQSGSAPDAESLGQTLAENLLQGGGKEILAKFV